MQTKLAEPMRNTAFGQAAEQIVRKCVHCGFCNATCPTYQLLGDELDGPRGRIYLIKEILEGGQPTASTQLHLDRCLTCRACETTCPSGVQFGRLLDIGRKLVDEKVERPASEQLLRSMLKHGLTSNLFAPAMRLGQALRPLLPRALQSKVPARRDPGTWPDRQHSRKVLLLSGCVQPSMFPNINAATARVLDALGMETIVPRTAGCCGANKHHLDDHARALDEARTNIDAWWPHLEAGAEAIVINASGCASMVKQYAHLLREDTDYAAKAERVVSLTRDLGELLGSSSDELQQLVRGAIRQRISFHSPCTLQHGQRLRGVVESLISELGAEILPTVDSHLCCGSAGSYSILQAELSSQLRDRKIATLVAPRPEVILSANVGCIAHLAPATSVPVRHWIEWLDARLRQ